ncbi:MAG: DUF423 domain-containing protein [Chitinophagales bacterium]|jgi:uncharacterized membrane protein YgdD (TMEM256/DUF423 family)|nr:DUF423 domain-containing protein [Chitinophagales bacterium]
MKKFALIACILGFFSVSFSAYLSHKLRPMISEYSYENLKMALQYIYYHLAPLFYLATLANTKILRYAGISILTGLLFFSGSILIMSSKELHHIDASFLWPVTPIGGLFLLLGWTLIFFGLYRENP